MILEIDSHQNITLSNYARRHFQYRNKNCTCLKILFTNARVTEMQREKEKSKNFMACWLHKKGIIKHLKGLKRITTHSKEPIIIISWICISSSWILLLLLTMMWIQHVWLNAYKSAIILEKKRSPLGYLKTLVYITITMLLICYLI